VYPAHVDVRELVRIAVEALARYKLRTALSVVGVVLGVAAVIAMMSVGEGAAREALAQVDALGLDNLVVRSQGSSAHPVAWRGLTAGEAERIAALVPLVEGVSPLIHRHAKAAYAGTVERAPVLGVRPALHDILRLAVERGRFLSVIDETASSRTAVLGSVLARRLFGFRSPLGEHVVFGDDYYEVVGVLRPHAVNRRAGQTLAWHDIDRSAFVPMPALSGRTLRIAPHQPVDELWIRVGEGERAEELGRIVEHALRSREVTVIIPRELLAQRHRTQRTFRIVVGSVAVLALLVGGIGIMNIMLTSVVERTKEIGVRRMAGATRRDVRLQFLVEALLMTLTGGGAGIVLGAAVSWNISTFAGWATHVSPESVALGFVVSVLVGVGFGLYPAIKAAALEPVDAMRYE
jgi:putative ABC transport system permease protein